MSLINLNALSNAPLQTDPFDYLVVPDFINADALALVNRDYPAIDTAANHALENLTYGSAFESLIEELRGPSLAAALGEQFSLELTPMPTTVTVRKFCERTDGNIHTDHKSKIITVLVYFNERWEHEEGQIRLLRSKNNIEDYAAQVSPMGGTLLAFRRTDHSWHGHKTFVGERRMLQLSFLQSGRLARWRQQIDRMGTRTMKRALRVFSPNA